tara:strand:+ start:7913 stop:8377 length:465 start_codon:yes stop_codon:yes gene_type:complete
MRVDVREVGDADAEQWGNLYAGYRSFYQLPADFAAVSTTWRWISQGQYGFIGLVAVTSDGVLAGLANLRRFARPSVAATGLYLDDLYTAPASRGLGVASALLRAAAQRARDEEASVVRWITAADNQVARRLYDQLAVQTHWVTYDMRPAELERG